MITKQLQDKIDRSIKLLQSVATGYDDIKTGLFQEEIDYKSFIEQQFNIAL